MSEFLDSQSELSCLNQKGAESNPLSTVSGLFVGLSNYGLSDSDCAKSPTSPLEFRVCCSHTTDPTIRSPRSFQNGHQFNLGCTKVGLSLVGSLDEDINKSGEIVFGPAIRIKFSKSQISSTESFQEPIKKETKVCPGFDQTQIKDSLMEEESGVVFEIGENPSGFEAFGLKHETCSAYSSWSSSSETGFVHPKSNSGLVNIFLSELTVDNPSSNILSEPKSFSGSIGSSYGSSSASEVELSEDYTCVILRGTNPKTTHIFGDRILECQNDEFNSFCNKEKTQLVTAPASTKSMAVFPSHKFLSFCDFCNKKLEPGEDIYIYRGEKAFCSWDCRSEEILMDMETEDPMDKSPKNQDKSDNP